MNLPNLITLSRIPMMFVIVGLMYCVFPGAATLAFVCFVLSAIGDWADGYLARKRGLISTFGKFMDALTDKVLVLGIMIAFVQLDVVQIIWVLVIIVREFLISGMRMMAASKWMQPRKRRPHTSVKRFSTTGNGWRSKRVTSDECAMRWCR